MARYQVILAYDGTEFYGFQRQAEGRRTVQGEVERALGQLGWSGSSMLAAGRTDAGVHATGQVAAFDLSWAHSADDLRNALNARLPADIAVRSAQPVPADFHPRYDALARRYRYRVYCEQIRDPLRERYAWRVWPPLSEPELHQAAQSLPGEWDFKAYGRATQPEGSTVRKVFDARWARDDRGLWFTIEANAFLYHMVRRIVYQQVQVGLGQVSPGQILEHLRGARQPVQGLAPPQGLVLDRVRYPPEES